MKQKIMVALCALMLVGLLAGCSTGAEDTSSTGSTSSVSSGNIPSGNTDGNYDNTSSDNSSKSLGSEINSMVSSGSSAINSMIK